MQERIKEEVLLAMHTARDAEEAFTDGSVDDITKAIMAVFEESHKEAFKRGYAQGGVDTILQHEKASQAVLDQLKQSKETP